MFVFMVSILWFFKLSFFCQKATNYATGTLVFAVCSASHPLQANETVRGTGRFPVRYWLIVRRVKPIASAACVSDKRLASCQRLNAALDINPDCSSDISNNLSESNDAPHAHSNVKPKSVIMTLANSLGLSSGSNTTNDWVSGFKSTVIALLSV